MQLRRPATTLFLLGFTLQSFALTIGRPQGAAWIGKPLDIVIPLTLDENEAGGDLCLEADVVQGDTRIDDRRVTLSLEPGAGPNAPRVHIRSTVAIDEPVVTVNVRAGCDMKSSRRYTLLADVTPEASLPSVARAPSPAGGAAASSGNFGASGAGVPPSRSASGRLNSYEGLSNNRDPATFAPYTPPERRAAPARRVAPPVAAAPPPRPAEPAVAEEAPRRPPAPPRRAVAAQAAQAPAAPPPAVRAPTPRPSATPARREAVAAGTPRLQLDALEPTPGREGGLRTTTELTAPGAENPALRAEAAALWRAIAATPEESQREAQRQQSMDATLAALREQTAQNQKTLAEMRGELAEARDNRYRNPLTYALGGLLLLALLGLFMLWRMLSRSSRDAAWWSEGAQAARVAERQGRESRAVVSRFNEPVEDDEAEDDDVAPPARVAPSPPAPPAPRMQMPMPQPVPVMPAFATARLVNTEELLDVQQQSDFFLSLGQHDQAIAVLSDHIGANPQTSALAYLDLLKIFHGLGRREDYDGVRQEFVNAFNADVPEFDGFAEAGGSGLESYRNTLARIESQWPAPSTLSLIEELVFRKPGGQDEVFDLAAYRELLLLYAVAKEVIDPDSTPSVPVTPLSFADTYGGEPQATVPGDFGHDTVSDALLPEAPKSAPSLYGAIEQRLQDDTVMAPDTPLRPVAPPNERHSPLPGMDGDYSEFDRTAYETLRAPIEPTAAPARPSASDPVDFDLFDADTEAEIAPRRPPKNS